MLTNKQSKIKHHNLAKTKIIGTLGPSSSSKEIILKMIEAGLDVFRLNFSHNTYQWHKEMFEKIRSISNDITIFFDLQGPKIRLGELIEPQILQQGNDFTLTTEEVIGDNKKASVSLKSLPKAVKKNDLIYINDGIIGLKVNSIKDNDIVCKVLSSGEIRSKKGINVPNVKLDVPSLTQKDLKDLEFALPLEPDYIAFSFVRSKEDIEQLRKIINDSGYNIPIISKIEHALAIKNFDKILQSTDAIMVARGDLGIETSVAHLPVIQKEIIYKSNQIGKPVITATQMLESMVTNPRPTRAEASDVANAIYDGSDAVMLSAETAVGNYPIESIQIMNEIALNVEKELHWRDYPKAKSFEQNRISEYLASAAGMLVEKLPIKAIIAFTEVGFSAKIIAKHRPKCRIFIATTHEKTIRQLGLIWGCYPLLVKEYQNTDQMVVESVEKAKKMNYLNDNDTILVISHSVLCPGKTNLIHAYTVSDIPTLAEFNALQ